MALCLEVVKSIELVMYLTMHVALEIALAAAEGTEVGLCTVVGPEAGRVPAEKQDGGHAFCLCPVARTVIAKPVLFFNQEKPSHVSWIFAPAFFCFLFLTLHLLPLLSFRILVRFLSSDLRSLQPACIVFCVAGLSILQSALHTSSMGIFRDALHPVFICVLFVRLSTKVGLLF